MFSWLGEKSREKPTKENPCDALNLKGRSLLTHTSKVGEVFLGNLVLLVLINPLVEVCLEEMNLLGLLQQTGPVGIVELLLAQLQLDIAGGMVDLALGRVNLGVELELEVVGPFEGIGVTGEGQAIWLEVQLQVGSRHIGNADGQVDKVLLGIDLGGALRPENYSETTVRDMW